MHFSILDVMIVKIKTVRWRLINTFFLSSASCFDLTGFFSPAFIMPIEKDFNLLCEIVCRKHGEAMNLISARETTKLVMQSDYFWETIVYQNIKSLLTFIDPGANPSGDKPQGRLLSGSTSFFAAITSWKEKRTSQDALF